MKEYIWGIIGTLIALVSLIIQFIKTVKVNRREQRERERDEHDALSLKLCNQIEYYNGIYRVKIINISNAATAYNLNVSIRIKNRHFNYTYKIPDVSAQETIYSIYQEKDKELCEFYTHINVMEIDEKELMKYASQEILNLYNNKTLGLKNLLKDKENYLAVRYNAVNRSTGRTVEFAKQEFVYEDIVHGRFGIGDDFVTRLE